MATRILDRINLAQNQQMTSALRGGIHALAGAFRRFVNACVSVCQGVVNACVSAYRAVVNACVSFCRGVVNACVNAYRAVVNACVSVCQGVVNACVSAYQAVVNACVNAYQGIVDACVTAYRNSTNAVVGSCRALTRSIGGTFQSFNSAVKGMAFKLHRTTVTISVEARVVRTVTFKGDRVVDWQMTELEERLKPPDDAGGPEAGRPPILKQLLKMLSRRPRVVTDMPTYAPLIRHLRLPKVRGRHRNQMIVSEVLETIPFEREEVDITWQLRQDSEGQEAFAIAVPKSQVDRHLRLVKEAELSPAAAYAKGTALTFAVGITDAIVVHIEQERVATVLVRQCTPRVVHQQEFPWQTNDLQEQANAVAMAVDQVSGYYQARGPEDEGGPLPVVLTGQLSNGDALLSLLPQVLQRPVLPFAPEVRYPDNFPSGEYAANVGLYLTDRARARSWGKAPGAIGPALDVLPPRHRPRPLPLAQIAVYVGLFTLLGLAILVTGSVNAKTQELDPLAVRLDQTLSREHSQRIAELQQLARTTELREAQAQAMGMESGLTKLEQMMGNLLINLVTITEETLPPNLGLTSLAPQEQGFALAGNANSFEDVFEYAENLRTSPHLKEARVIQVSGSGQGMVAFTIFTFFPEPLPEED